MDSLESGHLRKADTFVMLLTPMVSTSQRFHCGFLEDMLNSILVLVLTINFFFSKFHMHINTGGEGEF